MSEAGEAREWHRIIRASVRECLEATRALLAQRQRAKESAGRG